MDTNAYLARIAKPCVCVCVDDYLTIALVVCSILGPGPRVLTMDSSGLLRSCSHLALSFNTAKKKINKHLILKTAAHWCMMVW